MLKAERLQRIKEIIDQEKSASIEDLADELAVSRDTIRRDLIQLEKQQQIKRTHGGALALQKEATIFDYEQRATILSDIKKRMAEKARQLMKEPSSIIFDSSTTVEAVIRQLPDKRLQAVTNSLSHALLLANYSETAISLLPGSLHKAQLFLYGTETIEQLKNYQTDYTLLGVFALSSDGLFIHTEEEGRVKRQMIQQGRTVIALADHTKLDKTGFYKICDLSAIDYLITDQKPSNELIKALTENHVQLIETRNDK
ncbi:DeoR/GlpR transcriptional regulator [Enterococcus sp. DIV1298c]|uniref:DeoR/GlpR family DNA-binding transcription regulator n=1 Tax=Enterococcus sp. DIV1298c TaxID=2815328 RepID=UPI001A9273B7|nr:DeoR/GlpR family DNA-binding transcription regulator [Enterococcus sp. DIV1298c]MBO0460829.1 DeoR/GlpR transcriptional regulator [Enterococcus sp. DIV1298c]